MDWENLFGGMAAPVTFGGVAGLVVGYTAKKLTKLVALLLGILFIFTQVLAYEGFITINWMAVQHSAETVWRDPHGMTLADHLWDIVTANLPFGGAFAAGFAIGFKLG